MKSYLKYIWLVIFLFSLLYQGQNINAQEIPNGDGDLLLERSIYPRFVNDAKFHPINGNIIAAVNHEIWEIDPKDGHTIRVFEGGPDSGPYDQFECVQISSDGTFLVTNEGSGIHGIIIWDYNTGKIRNNFDNGESLAYAATEGIFPDNDRIAYFSYTMNEQGTYVVGSINIYSISQNKIIKYVKTPNQSADIMTLSKNGKYLAIGFRNSYSGQVDNFTMELWDAETLTKIRDYGEADAIEFRDVQISDDNNYIAFMSTGGSKSFYLFDKNGLEIGLSGMKSPRNMFFSNDSKKILMSSLEDSGYLLSVYDLNSRIKQYIYTEPRGLLRLNQNNELFSEGIYRKIQMFSNRWYTVGVKPNLESKVQVNYENDQLIITLPNEVIPQKISIMNLLGEIVYQTDELTELNDKIVLDLTLPNGIYLISLNDGQSTLFGKFTVVR